MKFRMLGETTAPHGEFLHSKIINHLSGPHCATRRIFEKTTGRTSAMRLAFPDADLLLLIRSLIFLGVWMKQQRCPSNSSPRERL